MTTTSLETTFQMIPFCNKFKIVNEYLEANCVFRKSTDFFKLSLFWAYSEDVENLQDLYLSLECDTEDWIEKLTNSIRIFHGISPN